MLGTALYTRRELEEARAAGRLVQIRVLGLATIADDVTPELALATIESVEVLGALPGEPGRQGGPGSAHRLTYWRTQ